MKNEKLRYLYQFECYLNSVFSIQILVKTAFFIIYTGNAKNVKMLIQHGADVNAENKEGSTALDFAIGSTGIGIGILFVEVVSKNME